MLMPINDDGYQHDLFIAQGRFSILMKDSGKAAMGDDAFVIEKHLSAGVQLPECPSDFISSFESFRSETLSAKRVGK